MKEANGRTKSGNRSGNAPEMRLAGIDFNPGPDAEERLRRLFTILVRLVDDDLPYPGAESHMAEGGDEERADNPRTCSDGLKDLIRDG